MIQFNVRLQDPNGQPVEGVVEIGTLGPAIDQFNTRPCGSEGCNFYNGPPLPEPTQVYIKGAWAAGFAPFTDAPNLIPFQAETVDHVVTLTPSFRRPSVEKVRAFRGNFCGLVLPYLQYGPEVAGGRLLFTPGIVCESPEVRRRAFADYRAAGYTHLPLNLTNHGSVYHNDYPPWDDAIINDVLRDALRAGLIPGGALLGDNDDALDCKADPSLVCWAFPKWEQNGPDITTEAINRHILACRAGYPDVPLYVHFTSRHAAGGSPEGDWWAWAWAQGVRGILYQQDLWNDTPEQVSWRCADFLVRFNDPHNYLGWPKGPDFVMFEDVAYAVYNRWITPAQGDAMNAALWALISTGLYPANGFCNGA